MAQPGKPDPKRPGRRIVGLCHWLRGIGAGRSIYAEGPTVAVSIRATQPLHRVLLCAMMESSGRQATRPHPQPRKAKTMNPAEFRCTREFLGLSAAWLADHLGVSLRSVARWESGSHPIPEAVAGDVWELVEVTSEFVAEMCATVPDADMVTYRTDNDFTPEDDLPDFPASWHRMVAARVADATGVNITY